VLQKRFSEIALHQMHNGWSNTGYYNEKQMGNETVPFPPSFTMQITRALSFNGQFLWTTAPESHLNASLGQRAQCTNSKWYKTTQLNVGLIILQP